ncbi:ABC transporter substrate-binding protein [Diaphorobacter caeni]|uniref:ABC transporter substrate-binding protein n=1 Tax=Diaphorobacter caeni TaxID=2784387 RepID=UPI00188F023D|nr:NrtA/SsuA/CpmA family ABC transporter substrate-binding protein [Diaphorobacter caeni]MBF5005123.1 NrtA/SsuA/CpmA family ABC transporter substrate-binding protein [Diaphorobacter caeni]
MSLQTLNRRQFSLGLGLSALSLASAHATEQKVVIAESQGFSWAIPYLVSSRNLWKNHGIEASTLQFTSGRLAFDAAVAGKAQFATSTDSVVGLAGANGVRSYIVAEFTRLSSGMVVVARTDRGISTPAQLKGKRIATTLGSSGHYFLSRYLSLYGLALKDVTVVNLRGPDAVTAITQGGIDAFAWGWDAGQQAIEQSAGKVVQLPAQGLERVFVSHYVLTANEEVVQKSPKVVEGAVRALLDAEAFYRARTDEAIALVAQRTKTTAETTREGLANVTLGVRLDDRLLDDLVLNGEWAVESGLAQRPAQDLRQLYRGLIYPDALRTAAADRVTLSR